MYEYDHYIKVDEHDYDSEDAKQFVNDCQAAGFHVEHYKGRFYWEGPAVRCDCISDIMSITIVRCQHDSMGLGVIVYPETSAELTEEAQTKMENWEYEEEDDN